ncbi:MAG: hypothetical protein AUJ01_01150 [Acidobacteria bacterium 13_1_40CM_3_65_5]|nr:MAG: hypothetical protein AUJ01_01150 [Acidobacteria bacterium 13_1_40CM_3_65_5]
MANRAVTWDIRREGRAWAYTPEKIEMVGGKLLADDEERLTLLGLLLENVGADAAVRLGDPNVWREAIGQLQ